MDIACCDVSGLSQFAPCNRDTNGRTTADCSGLCTWLCIHMDVSVRDMQDRDDLRELYSADVR